ncbi:MAG: alpha/beta hydrolase [Gammaproteobacteria bacterium]
MDILKRHNVRVLGRGRHVLIFAHGFGCDQNMWRFLVPAFDADYRVVLFDYVGHGGSDASYFDPERYATLDGYAADVLEICAALEVERVTFVGHSVSSMIGLLAALKEPQRFERLVLIGPSPCYVNDDSYVGGFSRADIDGLLDFLDSNHLGWSSTMAPVIMGNAERPELAEELTESFCRTNPEVAKHFARVTFLSDNREDLPRVALPCLIVQCANDAIAPLAVGEYVHRRIAGSRLTVLDVAGHCPHLSAPAETANAIRSFLEDTA